MKNRKESFTGKMQVSFAGMKIWWKENPQIMLSILFSGVMDAGVPYVGIWLLARLIDEIAGERNVDTMKFYALLMMSISAVLGLIAAGLRRWKNAQLASLWHIQNKVFSDKLLTMDFAQVDDSQVQNLRSQIWQNTDSGGWGLYKLVYCFEDFVRSTCSIIGAVVLTTSLFILPVPNDGGKLTLLNNPLFILVIIGVMAVVTFVAPTFSVKADSYWAKCAQENQLGNRLFGFWLGELGENPAKATDVRIYRQDLLSRKYLTKYNPFTPSGMLSKVSRGGMGINNAIAGGMAQILVGVAYIFVCLKALGGAFGVGSIVQYVTAITSLSAGLSGLVSVIGQLMNNTSFLKTVFELLDMPNEMCSGNKRIKIRDNAKFEIEFRNVTFRYPGQEKDALKNINTHIYSGKRLAVVGMNGSGKTTFIKLLCRLYDPTEGEILLNGINIKEINYAEYLQLFSVVFQDFKLLAFELGQNLAGSSHWDKEKAEKCLCEAGFEERYKTLPNGLSTSLYKDFDSMGVNVSGGEAQKIALARALYKDSPYIVLDEPTAALDPIAEYEVYSGMDKLVRQKTAVFISHRLSSCRFCDDIVVFHEGSLVQRGDHDTLMGDKNGMYYTLWSSQAQYYNTK